MGSTRTKLGGTELPPSPTAADAANLRVGVHAAPHLSAAERSSQAHAASIKSKRQAKGEEHAHQEQKNTARCNLCAASIQGTDNAGVGWQREQIAAQARSRGRFGQLSTANHSSEDRRVLHVRGRWALG